MRVLIADDQPGFVAALSLMLELDGYEIVAHAQNGVEAVKLCREHRPDVAILDIRMPFMDGFDALKLIKHEATAGRTVILSGSSSESDALRAQDVGADAYMVKDRLMEVSALLEKLHV